MNIGSVLYGLGLITSTRERRCRGDKKPLRFKLQVSNLVDTLCLTGWGARGTQMRSS